MNATLTHASIDLQGRMIKLDIIADINGIPTPIECGSSVDEVMAKQAENPLSLFETLTAIASEKTGFTVSVPGDLSEFLINI